MLCGRNGADAALVGGGVAIKADTVEASTPNDAIEALKAEDDGDGALVPTMVVVAVGPDGGTEGGTGACPPSVAGRRRRTGTMAVS